MKKSIICVLALILFSVVIVYGQEHWIDKFIESFELSNSAFKFYNIKSSVLIEKDMDIEQLEGICIEIAKNLNVDTNKMNVKIQQSEIYVNYNEQNTSISVIAYQKSSKESYIIVDILNNKVYKNIENIYLRLENELKKYSSDVKINICIAGEYTKKLQKGKINDILQKMLYNMYAEKIDSIEEENFLSVNAYSKLLNENNLKYLNRKMNLNIGIRYSEDNDRTMIYIATPIIKIDY
ncbi:YwmB family TATA-box binding protein [Intestinibacter sp.]|uniref:YwmB family TATA-box binding protein n=1 Tax=Intestinibacter sp. TaxID=1965304 RepID=UPI003F16EBFD